jgi:hypothetical protein
LERVSEEKGCIILPQISLKEEEEREEKPKIEISYIQ